MSDILEENGFVLLREGKKHSIYLIAGVPSMIFGPEEVSKRLRDQPFVPLQIVTTTGQTYDVRHPELVLITRRFLEIGLPSSKNPLIADQITRVALIHVTELRDLPTATSPPSNGSA